MGSTPLGGKGGKQEGQKERAAWPNSPHGAPGARMASQRILWGGSSPGFYTCLYQSSRDFPTSGLLTSEAGSFLLRGLPEHCRESSSVPDLHPPVVTTRNVSRQCKCPLGGKITLLRTAGSSDMGSSRWVVAQRKCLCSCGRPEAVARPPRS